jgi:hypothetical protein
MVTPAELQARVAASYDALGLPSWPNPHPEPAQPREEEYSRVTAPERYRIGPARGRVWADRLAELPGVTAEALSPAPLDGEGRLGRFDRGVRLTPARPGTLPLLLLERDAPLAVLHISVVEPGIGVQMLPDCGCDACDLGSDDLLDAIDETIRTVVGGPFVLLRGPGWHAQWYPDGGSSGGTGAVPDHRWILELGRRLAGGEDVPLPDGTEAFVGRAWLP